MLEKKLFPLALLGALISGYSVYHYLAVNSGFQSGPSFCSLSAHFDCDSVARSPYAAFLGIPVGSFGLLYFLVVLGLLRYGRAEVGLSEGNRLDVLLAISSLSLLPTIILFLLSAITLKTLCVLCLLLDLTTFVCFFLIWGGIEKGTFFRSLLSGLKSIATFFLPYSGGTSREWVHLHMARVLFFVTVALVYVLPSHVILRYFIEAAAKSQEEELAEQILNDWKLTQPIGRPLEETGDLSLRDYSLGEQNAPVTIVEFSDFECPFCRKMAPELKALINRYPGKVRLIYKNFPLDKSCNPNMERQLHDFACRAAVMARCAGKQGEGSFWSMHDALIKLGSFSDERLKSLPVELGLGISEFDACVEDPQTLARVVQDIEIGSQFGINGTPAFFVNGRPLRAPHIGALERIVKSLL